VRIERAPERAVSPATIMRLEHARAALPEGVPGLVAPVRAVGREDDGIHLVTAMPPGASVDGLADGPLPLPDALAVAGDVLTALAELHARGDPAPRPRRGRRDAARRRRDPRDHHGRRPRRGRRPDRVRHRPPGRGGGAPGAGGVRPHRRRRGRALRPLVGRRPHPPVHHRAAAARGRHGGGAAARDPGRAGAGPAPARARRPAGGGGGGRPPAGTRPPRPLPVGPRSRRRLRGHRGGAGPRRRPPGWCSARRTTAPR
jgi:hypothetical protein